MRTITVVFDIIDQDAAAALWSAHASGTTILGMNPHTIQEGDAVKELEELNEKTCAYLWVNP